MRRLPFLGFTFGRLVSWKTRRPYLGPTPSAKKISGICERIVEETSNRTLGWDVAEQVAWLNQILRGWDNYFRLGSVQGAWQVVQQQACCGLRRWLRRKRGQVGGVRGDPDMVLYDEYGLVDLRRDVVRISLWA